MSKYGINCFDSESEKDLTLEKGPFYTFLFAKRFTLENQDCCTLCLETQTFSKGCKVATNVFEHSLFSDRSPQTNRPMELVGFLARIV